MGRAQEEARHELREAEPRSALLLPPRHRAQERGAQVHVPLRGPRAWASLSRPCGRRAGSNDPIKIPNQATLCCLHPSHFCLGACAHHHSHITPPAPAPQNPMWSQEKRWLKQDPKGNYWVLAVSWDTQRFQTPSPLRLPRAGTCTGIRPYH